MVGHAHVNSNSHSRARPSRPPLRGALAPLRQQVLGPVRPARYPYDRAVVAEPVGDGRRRHRVAEHLRPGPDPDVGGDDCVLSSLVEPPPSRICEPLPVAWRRMPNGIRHDKVSHPRHRNPSRSRQAPPPMRAWRTRQDSPLNCTSLPWWTTLSITAAAIWSSPKTLPQRLNSRLVVKTTDCRS